MDGKTSQGARLADGTRVHLPGVAEHGGRLLDHLEVDVKHNETSHFTELLEPLDLDGAVVTSDALHTVRANLNWLVEDKKSHYIAIVKGNTPKLYDALDALDWAHVPVSHTAHDRGHGRDETRTPQVLPAPKDCFPHAAQAFLIERTVRDPHDGQLRSAVAALGITSRTRKRGGTPEVIAAAARGHWDIEALHYVRDTTMNEDAQRLRAGSSAQVMASARTPGRLHQHRARPALGGTKPRQAHRRPESRIT